jgi:hypothetical protein
VYVKGGRLGTYSHRDWDEKGGKRSPKICWGVVITTNCHSTAPTWSQPDVPGRLTWLFFTSKTEFPSDNAPDRSQNHTNWLVTKQQKRGIKLILSWCPARTGGFHMVSHGFTHQKGALNHGKGGVIILAAVLFEVVPPPNATRFEGALETSGVGSPHVE